MSRTTHFHGDTGNGTETLYPIAQRTPASPNKLSQSERRGWRRRRSKRAFLIASTKEG